jgi:uncharacterized protein
MSMRKPEPVEPLNLIELMPFADCGTISVNTCKWKCGNSCAHEAPNQSEGETFQAVLGRFFSRRVALKGAAAAGAALVVLPQLPGASGTAGAQGGGIGPNNTLAFTDVSLNNDDKITLSPGYDHRVLIKWGDPLFLESPPFDLARQTAEAQEMQFGYNCDFVGFYPLPLASRGADRALLVVNHEYTNPDLMFQGYTYDSPTKQHTDIELAAHGLSVVELRKPAGGPWEYVVGSRYNRRVTAETDMLVTGPAAGHDLLKTSADPSGAVVRGMLNNCAAGKTPWGTVLTCEENFHQYFGNAGRLPDDDPRKALHRRYGVPTGASERKWERFHTRFDVAQEPNEPFRHGWVVEIDPYDPTSIPMKRTAMGRFKHEGATVVIAPDGRAVIYSGDDERFDYAYKFVTEGKVDLSNRLANRTLLDSGTLYVAKFNDDGTGEWIPLIAGQGPLTAARGFPTQAEVAINTRQAADLVGATKMDRPEDIETNPVNGKVYMIMTNNSNRGAMNQPGVDAANPRPNNRWGHILEVSYPSGDPTSTRFAWDMFMLCGDPANAETGAMYAGYPTAGLSAIAAPDNLVFDQAGNLWIATDGQESAIRRTDAVFAVPVEGPNRGRIKPFFTSVPGSEICGPEFSTDYTAFFAAIQHPGEPPADRAGMPVSRWPNDATNLPRPSVIVIWKTGPGSNVIGA